MGNNPLESEVVDRPDKQTVSVRQGTGPRATVSVLIVSLALAAIAGAVFYLLFIG